MSFCPQDYERFSAIVDDSIAFNLSRRCRFDPRLYDIASYAKEFCTVRVNLGRQVGKTRWILENSSAGDLIVLANQRACNDLVQRFVNRTLWHHPNREVSFINGTILGGCLERGSKLVNRRYDRILCDEFQGHPGDVYRALAKDPTQTFLFFG